jgi:polyisoprenyl-phosphate glycosyltransferase
MKPENIAISIAIPLFNEEENIGVLYERLTAVLSGIASSYEIIFVDDGSTDSSFSKIIEISKKDQRVKGMALSRNFGHQIALTAGLEYAKGDVVITMDADLQHPPEMIPRLYEEYKKGNDVVNTFRETTADAGLLKRFTSFVFYKLINRLSDVYIEPASADFRLMSRKALDGFLKIKEKTRFTRGLITWMGYTQTMVHYHAAERFSGSTKYTFKKMLAFGLEGVASFSTKPLRISFYLGLITSLVGLLYSVYAIINYFKGHTVPGWTSILVSVLILGGIQLISIGIIGEYLARVFNEAKGRPLYLVKDYAGILNGEAENLIS